MEMIKSPRFLWVLLIVAVLIGGVWQFYPLEDASKRMRKLPLNGIGFIGKNVALSDWEQNFFKNVNVIKRLYQTDTGTFFVTALDGTKNRHIVHDPSFCFKGGGWTITDEDRLPLPLGEAALLTLDNGKQTQEALYWFSDGDVQYASPLRYWIQTTLRRLSLGTTGDEPLLIVVQPVTSEPVNWQLFLRNLQPLSQL